MPPFARWNVEGDQVTVTTDRHGIHPLFIWCDNDRFAVSPSIPQLLRLGAPRVLDEPALAAFLRLGFFVGEDTPFQSIRAVPGGSHTLRIATSSQETEEDLDPVEPCTLNRDAAIDRYIELFRTAIAAEVRPGRRIVLPLSGGRDSRHILLEMVRQGHAPELCLTATYYPPRPNVDLNVARALAAHCHVPHRAVGQAPSQLTTLRRHIHETGFCTLTPSSFIQPIADFCRTHDMDCIVDGVAGDTLSSGHFLSREADALYAAKRFDELADLLLGSFNGMSEQLIGAMLSSDLLRRTSRELAKERLIRELKRHRSTANPVTSFVFFNRTRRDIALMPTRIYRAIPHVACPYLFPDLVDFLYSLPAEMVVDHQFHNDAIRRGYPAANKFPYEQHAPDRRDRLHQFRFAAELARHIVGQGRGGLFSERFVWPRTIRCLVDPGYLPSISWFGPPLAYLTELGALLASDSPLPTLRP